MRNFKKLPILTIQDLHDLTWVKESGDERVALCPFCGESKGHLYVNSTKGKYNCFVCGAGGEIKEIPGSSLRRFKSGNTKFKRKESPFVLPDGLFPIYEWSRERFGRLCSEQKDLTKFMLDRGLFFDDIVRFSVCWKEGFLFFPLFSPYNADVMIAGEWCRLNRDNPNAPKYWDEGPYGKTLFNLNHLNGSQSIVVVEGIIDTIAILRAMGDEFSVVGSLRAKLTEDQRSLLAMFSSIIWALDNDEAGRKALQSNCRVPGSVKHFKVVWPEKDPGLCSRDQIVGTFKRLELLNYA